MYLVITPSLSHETFYMQNALSIQQEMLYKDLIDVTGYREDKEVHNFPKSLKLNVIAHMAL